MIELFLIGIIVGMVYGILTEGEINE